MKVMQAGKVILVGWVAFLCLQATLVAGQTNAAKIAIGSLKITTNFIAEAQLSVSEIKQVLKLAKACGIKSPSEVETYHTMPAAGMEISVKSTERVNGRNTSFDTLTLSKDGWDQRHPGKDIKRVGPFWAFTDEKYSTLLRRYEFKNEAIQIDIGKGVDSAFADKVIHLFEAQKIRLDNDWARLNFKRLNRENSPIPYGIYKSSSGKGYELGFSKFPAYLFHFDVMDGQIVVTGVSVIFI